MPQRKAATTTRGKRSTHTKKPAATKASPKAKSNAGSRARATAGKEEVTIDRRRRASRRAEDLSQRADKPSASPPLERRAKVNRRRQIDPTTCERDYSDEEIEFMNAIDEYKRQSGRMFPTCSEVLEVVRSLGYVKSSPAEVAAQTQAAAQNALTNADDAGTDDGIAD